MSTYANTLLTEVDYTAAKEWASRALAAAATLRRPGCRPTRS